MTVIKAHGGDRAKNLESIATKIDQMLPADRPNNDDNVSYEIPHGDARTLRGYAEQLRIVAEELGRKHPAMKALEELTPGGSEFVNDPAACLRFARSTRDGHHRVIIQFKRRADVYESAYRSLLNSFQSYPITARIEETDLKKGAVDAARALDELREDTEPIGVVKVFDDRTVADLIGTALEGGSNSWYNDVRGVRRIDTPGLAPKYEVLSKGESRQFNNGGPLCPFKEEGGIWNWYMTMPFVKGYEIQIYADEGNGEESWHTLDRAALRRGLQLMSEGWLNEKGERVGTHHYGNLLSENDDAETADVFLQIALFGEVVYG